MQKELGNGRFLLHFVFFLPPFFDETEQGMKGGGGGLCDVSQYSDGKKKKLSSICAQDNKSFSLHLIIQMFRKPHGREETPVPTSFKARDQSPYFSLPATLKSHAKYHKY